MGSFFGFNPGTSNNAPLPIPGQGNPTGANNGSGGSKSSASFPSFPIVGPSANVSPFGSGTNGLANLSSGLNLSSGSVGDINNAYGSGFGSTIESILNGGLFNPQVAQAYLASMAPSEARGLSATQGSFGAEGARFGSAAALGIGDYESQVNLNEQTTLANLFMNSQNQEVSLLASIAPTIHSERAASSGIFDDILGGLEIAGGIAAAPFTGGASLALVGSGATTLSKGVDAGTTSAGGGGGGSPNLGTSLQSAYAAYQKQQNAGNVQSIIANNNPQPTTSTLPDYIPEISAGADLGGSDPFSGGGIDGSSGDSDPTFMSELSAAGIVPYY